MVLIININNINSYNNNLYNNIRNEATKSKGNNSKFTRPSTVINIRKNYQNNGQNIIKQNNIGVITDNKIINDPKYNNELFFGMDYNKKTTQDPRLINVKIFNATMNSFSQDFLNENNKTYSKKKIYNLEKNKQYNNKNFIKKTIFNLANSANGISFEGIRGNGIRTIESMYNLINFNNLKK